VKFRRFLTATIACAIAAALAGCRASGETPAAATSSGAEVPTVAVIRPERRTADQSITLPGDLVGFYEAALHAKVTGYLKSISIDKGDWVKEGQVLAEIEVPELAQNLERARSSLEITNLTYERLDRVRKSDPRLVAQEDVDIARSKYLEAKAGVGELEAMVRYTKIVAPFDGVITGRFADPGALIKAGGADVGVSGSGANVSSGALEGAGGHLGGGGAVVSEARIDKLRVYVYVPEREAGLIKIGMPAQLTLRAFPGETFHASVTRFATSLDLATRTMLTEIDIDNPEHRLYPRMYANVTLDLVRHPNAIEVPRSAVQGIGRSDAYLFVVAQNRLARIPVTTGFNDGSEVEITSGLEGSELVVQDLSPALVAGEEVRPAEVPLSTASAEPAAESRAN
jgi:membrane fusion protein, multidrug efflux system